MATSTTVGNDDVTGALFRSATPTVRPRAVTGHLVDEEAEPAARTVRHPA
ncbi:MAG: hypothetical protein ABSF84_16410 [Acidimicrobiales bacterium]|jgi:hypothetical protein